ncbi:S-adenosyl-L-methionine-dependent methyltransferase [Pelagophyceae sp. CCMP2097]|nr:S-adenosyl-L-methionine-dependent methyltransferase [Pelagophyceae sp. CCMP2097]
MRGPALVLALAASGAALVVDRARFRRRTTSHHAAAPGPAATDVAADAAHAANDAAANAAAPAAPPGWRRAWARRGNAAALARSAAIAGVPPPWRAPKWVWRFAWRLHGRLLPRLHGFDAPPLRLRETCVNLRILWLKALHGDATAYVLLPRWTRLLVAPVLRPLYPRLHHANVAIRSAYLDKAVGRAVDALVKESSSPRVDRALASLQGDGAPRVVVLGAGFDTRALRGAAAAQQSGRHIEYVEVDLPDVAALLRARFETGAKRDRRDAATPRFLAANLSDVAQVRHAIAEATAGAVDVVFVVEALLIYLGRESADALLRECSKPRAGGGRAALCFADTIVSERNATRADVAAALSNVGFRLETYAPKPGLARHMGLAWTN